MPVYSMASFKESTVRAIGSVLFCLFAVAFSMGLFSVTFGAREGVVLPNGMVLKPKFDLSRHKRHDLYTANGKVRLTADIELVCFDDQYVWVIGYATGARSLFDGETQARSDADIYSDMVQLSIRGGPCNGYFSAWIGPSLLHRSNKAPFLPSCWLRNTTRKGLADADWLNFPCVSRLRGAQPVVGL